MHFLSFSFFLFPLFDSVSSPLPAPGPLLSLLLPASNTTLPPCTTLPLPSLAPLPLSPSCANIPGVVLLGTEAEAICLVIAVSFLGSTGKTACVSVIKVPVGAAKSLLKSLTSSTSGLKIESIASVQETDSANFSITTLEVSATENSDNVTFSVTSDFNTAVLSTMPEVYFYVTMVGTGKLTLL